MSADYNDPAQILQRFRNAVPDNEELKSESREKSKALAQQVSNLVNAVEEEVRVVKNLAKARSARVKKSEDVKE